MEITVIYSVSIVLFTFILSLLSYRLKSNSGVKLPPGSFGWPFIGETLEFLFGKPENFVRKRMKKYSTDIFKTKILGEKTVVLCGPNGHKFIFSNEQTYFTAFRPHPMQRLFRSYETNAPSPAPAPTTEAEDKEHEKSKALRQPGFLKPEFLARFIGEMESISADLIESEWDGKDVVKVYPLAKTVTLTIACRFFLGMNNPERITKLVDHFDNVSLGLHSIMLNFPGTIFHRANKSADAIRKELKNVIREKKDLMAAAAAIGEAPMQDLLSHMIRASSNGGGGPTADQEMESMQESVLADKMMGLLVAGYSTVAATITFFMKNVGERPDIYEKLRTEQMEIAANKKPGELLQWEDMQKMKYSWNVICETMRFYPPLQGTFREVLTEFNYAGYTIPKGWKVFWTVSSTNMNPTYFKIPEKFDPSRYEGESQAPYTYVPFGGGPRLCPGKEYARLAILTFVHNAINKYRWEVVFPNEKITGDMMPTPEKGLPIRLHRL